MTVTTRSRTTTPLLGSLRTRGFLALLRAEGRLFLRDVGNLVFVLAFPTILLVGMGFAIPGMREPITDSVPPWQGLAPVHLFAPIMVCVSIATAGLSALPASLAAYRERGVLRRLSTTPMQPHGILLAQLIVQVVGMVVGATLAIAVGMVVFDVPLPDQLLLALVLIVPAAASIFGLGLVIGGLAAKATTASGIGMLVYFPMLFFAGLWTPGPLMPDALAAVARFTPLGAASQALSEAWFGGAGMPWLQIGVMVAWAAGSFVLAARTFRWS